MRKMLFLLLAFPLYASAQPSVWDIFFTNKNIDSIGKRIHLPERGYNPNFKYPGLDHNQRPGSYVITTDSVYKQLFGRYIYTDDSLKNYKKAELYKRMQNRHAGSLRSVNFTTDGWWYGWMQRHHVDSIPAIDFSKYELVVYTACYYCLTVCDNNEPCHRNACSYMEKYFLRKKTIIINRE